MTPRGVDGRGRCAPNIGHRDDGHRLATQGRDGRARPLRVDMQVRLSGIAAITDATEHVPGFTTCPA